MHEKKKLIFAILDGWGLAPNSAGNAIAQARTPTLDSIERMYPSFSLQASGIAVGLPWGEEGNSEVGHLNLGAGRVVFQYLPRIEQAIRDESFFTNEAFKKAFSHVQKHNSTLHIMGLLSSGSVHSYLNHWYGLLEFAKRENIKNVVLHVFTDGKDSSPTDGAKFLEGLQMRIESLGVGRIGTVMGRAYAMDRNNRWDFTERAYALLTKGAGKTAKEASAYVAESYKQGVTDLDIEPAVITKSPVSKNDALIFLNFREDSARQITKAFVLPDNEFVQFSRKKIENLLFVGMTEYEKLLPIEVAFPPPSIPNPLAKVLSDASYKQLHISETEKYAHVTYFFNGARERPFEGEERILIPSVGTPHYDRMPEMGSVNITQKIVENFDQFDAFVINYANADMLGHTGNMDAAIIGIEVLDNSINTLLQLSMKHNAYLCIVSDHGNAENMIDPRTGTPDTKHTDNPIPFYIVHPSLRISGVAEPLNTKAPDGILADASPTVLALLGIEKPKEMTGENLL